MSYFTPNIYVEENSNVNRPLQGTSNGIAAFIGITEKGPTNEATLITSFQEFVNTFGGYITTSYLPNSVEAFFAEAGSGAKCYVTRVVHYTDITDESTNTNISASTNLLDANDVACIKAESTISEEEGNNYRITVLEATAPTAEGDFTNVDTKIVTVKFNKTMKAATLIQGNFSSVAGGAITAFTKAGNDKSVEITFTNALTNGDTVIVSASVTDTTDVPVTSTYRTLTKGTAFVPTFKVEVYLVNTSTALDYRDNLTSNSIDNLTFGNVNFTKLTSVKPKLVTKQELTGGNNGLGSISDNDYIGSSASETGLYSLDSVDENLNIVIPGITTRAVHIAAAAYAENKKCFFIGDAPSGLSYSDVKDFKLAIGTYAGESALDSKHSALYYPWIYIKDPEGTSTKLVPPSGSMAGIYARVSGSRGVHKAPAGVIDGKLRTALGIEKIITDTQQSELNPNGINVIRSFPDAGIVAWGARTTSSDTAWKYVNVRLHFNYIMHTILKGTKWAVFEPNDSTLWSKLTLYVKSFLLEEYKKGALADGGTGDPSQAFFVVCDSSNNTETTINNGEVKVDIGVAENKPGEFIIFNISQWDGGRLINE